MIVYRMRVCLFMLALFLLQEAGSATGVDPQKSLPARRVTTPILIDGKLNEQAWSQAPYAEGFIQNEPNPGAKATHDTKVMFLYDGHAIYIGAILYDPEPSKILHELCIRDNTSNSDLFRVFLDAYQSGLNGFSFSVNAAGVQSEAIVSNHQENLNWNAVWDSEVRIDSMGWVVEMKIPFSSLRFPKAEWQQWNVQFTREIRRFRETSHWSKVDPLVNGWVQQSGRVDSLGQLASPLRLSLTPFVTAYLNSAPDPGSQKFTPSYSAGADLKYGINQAFTLDMALVPDFGQVISDRQVLNLSPFEVFFDENRQFFTEGTELFNRDGLFYSRRIGSRPLLYGSAFNQLGEGEKLVSNPDVSQLYNATKISGRTAGGTGLGFFNALVGREHAVIEDSLGNRRNFLTNPLTNYNILVADQNLVNNSYLRVIHTSTTREGSFTDAHVTGINSEFKTRDQKYSILARGVMSQRFSEQGPDRGYSSTLRLGKFGGKWTWNLQQVIETDRYNPNDLGFLQSPNEQTYTISGAFQEFKPRSQKVQLYNFKSNILYSRLFRPDVYSDFAINVSHFLLWRSRDAYGVTLRFEPFDTRDFFEPRTRDFSKYLDFPENYLASAFFSSDYRKPLALDINGSYRWFDAKGRQNIGFGFMPRIRFSDRISLFGNLTINNNRQEPGYVNRNLVPGETGGWLESDVLIGTRDRWIVDNSVSGRYIFNNKMGFTLRVRHYWDRVTYSAFGKLREDGLTDRLDFDGRDDSGHPIFDQNFNIFNVDLQYNWRFAPGSDLIFVWKNQIFSNGRQLDSGYFRNFSELFDHPQTNSISVRILYFLDYLDVEKRLRREV